MGKYIDKSALVAEIEKLKDELKASDSAAYAEAYIIGAEHTIKTISDVIDTLEVKEVDLEKEIKMVRKHHFINDDFDKVEIDGRAITNIAKHFFELGLKAQKGE